MAIWRATFSGLLWGNIWNNVVHFSTGSPGPTVDVIANHLNNNWVEQVKTFQHNQLQWLDVAVRDVTTTPGPSTYHLPINKFGTSSAATATDTNLVTLVVKFQTAYAGRHGRGRILVAGVPSGRFNLGIVIPANLTIWQNTANTLYNLYKMDGVNTINLVVTNRANPGDYKTVTGITIRATQGTCRSRGYGIGT